MKTGAISLTLLACALVLVALKDGRGEKGGPGTRQELHIPDPSQAGDRVGAPESRLRTKYRARHPASRERETTEEFPLEAEKEAVVLMLEEAAATETAADDREAMRRAHALRSATAREQTGADDFLPE